MKKEIYILAMVLCVFSLLSCDKENSCRDGKKEVFDAFESRLKIDPVAFKMASELDTINFQLSVDFDGFTSSSGLLRFCKPTEYENYWTNFNNGSYLNLYKDDFQMQLVIIFNDERFVGYQVRKENEDYILFEPFTDNLLEEYSIELLPIYELNNIYFNEVVRIQAKNDGELIQEFIYQKENGILSYRNLENKYQYHQIIN